MTATEPDLPRWKKRLLVATPATPGSRKDNGRSHLVVQRFSVFAGRILSLLAIAAVVVSAVIGVSMRLWLKHHLWSIFTEDPYATEVLGVNLFGVYLAVFALFLAFGSVLLGYGWHGKAVMAVAAILFLALLWSLFTMRD